MNSAIISQVIRCLILISRYVIDQPIENCLLLPCDMEEIVDQSPSCQIGELFYADSTG